MIKQILSISAVAMAAAFSVPTTSFAQAAMDHSKMDHGKMDMSASADMTLGEVKKVDPANGKVTIKHGDIKNLDMPGMTMVFTAKDKDLLNTVKAGDKIQFTAVNDGGKLVVTAIQPAK